MPEVGEEKVVLVKKSWDSGICPSIEFPDKLYVKVFGEDGEEYLVYSTNCDDLEVLPGELMFLECLSPHPASDPHRDSPRWSLVK